MLSYLSGSAEMMSRSEMCIKWSFSWRSAELMSQSETCIKWSSACFVCCNIFLKVLVPAFLCSFLLYTKNCSAFQSVLEQYKFYFSFLDEDDQSALKLSWYIENFVRGKYLILVLLIFLKNHLFEYKWPHSSNFCIWNFNMFLHGIQIICTWAGSNFGSSTISFRQPFMGSVKVTVSIRNVYQVIFCMFCLLQYFS